MKSICQLRLILIAACTGLLWTVLALSATADDPPRAHVILAVDSDRVDLQDHVERDRDNLVKVFKDAFAKRRGRLKLQVIPQKEMTPEAVTKLLTGLKKSGEVRPTDTVFFYYSGHGAMHEKEHILKLRAGDLARKKLKQLLQELDAHNTILITDCCSDGLPKEFLGDPLPELPAADWPVLDGLLFQHQGFTDINSCQSGTKAWNYIDNRGIHQGGVFTMALAKLFCAKPAELSPDNELVGWPDFIGHLTLATNENFQRLKTGKLKIKDLTQQWQTPQIYSLGMVKPRRLIDHPWLFGVGTVPVADGSIRASRLQAGSPAAEHLQVNDVIESINSVRIRTQTDFTQAIDNSGGEIDLTVLRAGRRITLPGISLRPIKPEPEVPPAKP